MPTTYAHYRFGRDVLASLPESCQETIEEYRDLYNIGLHGPDLLFYYKALVKNPVNRAGFAMHDRPGREFFETAAPAVQNLKDQTAARAYLFGFLCHFALDSNCHPYVEKMVRESTSTHSAIEAELDRYLMEKDGLNPMYHKPAGHLKACAFHARVISLFFPDLDVVKIEKCIRSIRFYCGLLAPPGAALHRGFAGFMKLIGCSKSFCDMVIRPEKIQECVPMCGELERLYQKAVQDAAELIENFDAYIDGAAKLDGRLEHTFGEF